MALYYVLKSGTVMPLALLFPQDCFGYLGLLCFYMNFRIVFIDFCEEYFDGDCIEFVHSFG
jgi:hypothetical protein